MNSHWNELKHELEKIHTKNLFRQYVEPEGIDFCSNDYLGLGKSPELKKSFIENISQFTLGSTASRLVRGHRKSMSEFEEKFSQFVDSEDSLLVANGYIANMGLIDTIADSKTFIFTDRLNHASILDGIRISGAQKKYFAHLDMDDLELQIQKVNSNPENQLKRKLIVTETLFSMDGDTPNLKRLMEIKNKYSCILILDEAHALGVYGKNGRGMCFDSLTREEIQNIEYRIFTLGKSMGLEGGIIATSKIGKNYLVNRMRTFIFSTAPLPVISQTAIRALEMLESSDEKREHLKIISMFLKDQLTKKGFELAPTTSHIIPVLLQSEKEALDFSEALKLHGFDVRAIRPPTVPRARLRLSLNANLSQKEIENFIVAMEQTREELKVDSRD